MLPLQRLARCTTRNRASRFSAWPPHGGMAVRLDVVSTKNYVHADHREGCPWNYPHCSRELAVDDGVPERQWRDLNTCQFHTLVHARVPRVECSELGVEQVKVPWAEAHGRFTRLMKRFVMIK
jgi:transposase